MPPDADLPLITIGIVVLNREWIIKRMLASVQSQTYPHDRLFVLLVDGQSKDDTVKSAKEILASSDFGGYEIIVKKSNIPEARNICIQNMRGDFLLFWDSDVIMEPTAVARMLVLVQNEKVDMVSPFINEVQVASLSEIEEKWQNWEKKFPKQEKSEIVSRASTGNVLISKKVLDKVSFDPSLSFFEDQDFSSRASQLGFKILQTRNIIGFDVNSKTLAGSVYAFDIPLKEALRGIGKKARIQAQNITSSFSSVGKAARVFFWTNKRYLFYIGYIPAIVLTLVGVFMHNLWVALVLPVYFLLYMIAQIAKRGLVKGLNASVRSFVVGIPTTYALLYYLFKLSFSRK